MSEETREHEQVGSQPHFRELNTAEDIREFAADTEAQMAARLAEAQQRADANLRRADEMRGQHFRMKEARLGVQKHGSSSADALASPPEHAGVRPSAPPWEDAPNPDPQVAAEQARQARARHQAEYLAQTSQLEPREHPDARRLDPSYHSPGSIRTAIIDAEPPTEEIPVMRNQVTTAGAETAPMAAIPENPDDHRHERLATRGEVRDALVQPQHIRIPEARPQPLNAERGLAGRIWNRVKGIGGGNRGRHRG